MCVKWTLNNTIYLTLLLHLTTRFSCIIIYNIIILYSLYGINLCLLKRLLICLYYSTKNTIHPIGNQFYLAGIIKFCFPIMRICQTSLSFHHYKKTNLNFWSNHFHTLIFSLAIPFLSLQILQLKFNALFLALSFCNPITLLLCVTFHFHYEAKLIKHLRYQY